MTFGSGSHLSTLSLLEELVNYLGTLGKVLNIADIRRKSVEEECFHGCNYPGAYCFPFRVRKKSNVEAPSQPQASTFQIPQAHPTETPAPTVDKVGQAAAETKINDLLTKNYPGDWKVSGSTLSKGSYTENGTYKIVDDVTKLFPGTMGVSIFIGEERISSSVKKGTERVLKGYATPTTVGEVMKSGTSTSTLSGGYLKVYVLFKDSSGKTVAVMTASVPQT